MSHNSNRIGNSKMQSLFTSEEKVAISNFRANNTLIAVDESGFTEEYKEVMVWDEMTRRRLVESKVIKMERGNRG